MAYSPSARGSAWQRVAARGSWDAARIDACVCMVARAAGDEEWAKRGKGAHTLAQLAAS